MRSLQICKKNKFKIGYDGEGFKKYRASFASDPLKNFVIEIVSVFRKTLCRLITTQSRLCGVVPHDCMPPPQSPTAWGGWV